MPLECSYAGIALPLATPELQAWVAQLIPTDYVTEFEFLSDWPARVAHLPMPPKPRERPIRLGVLVWPQHASRFAVFHAVVNKAKLDEIRTAVGDPSSPQPFVMDDGREVEDANGGILSRIETDLYLLPPRVLADCNLSATSTLSGEPLYLITLVDDRFYYHWKAGSVDEPETWADVFSSLGTVLEVTVNTDTVHADYETPSDRWETYYGPPAALLDAACTAVGHRYVRDLDGTDRTQTYATALAAVNDQYESYSKVAGGYTPRAHIQRYVPESVSVLFRRTVGGVEQDDPYLVTKLLVDLAITEYEDAEGVTGTSATVVADFTYDGSNAVACDDLAERAAADWYGWQLADLDTVYGGVVAWEPTAMDHEVEWSFGYGPGGDLLATTRVRRAPWNWEPRGDWRAPAGRELEFFFAEVLSGTDADGYEFEQRVLVGPNVWDAPPDPESGTGFRAPSEASDPGLIPPAIPAGQYVLVRRTTYAAMTLDVEYTAEEGEVTFGTVTPDGGTPAYTYEWDFGDGDTSTDDNPVHTYADPGPYTVTVTVTDSGVPPRVQEFEFVIEDTDGGTVGADIAAAAAAITGYEMTPWGGIQGVQVVTAVSFNPATCSLTVTTKTLYGRDLYTDPES